MSIICLEDSVFIYENTILNTRVMIDFGNTFIYRRIANYIEQLKISKLNLIILRILELNHLIWILLRYLNLV